MTDIQAHIKRVDLKSSPKTHFNSPTKVNWRRVKHSSYVTYESLNENVETHANGPSNSQYCW